MDLTKAGLWISLFVGGLVIGLISAYIQYTSNKDDEFRFRPVVRDFCLGAVVSAVLYSFLPESIDDLVNSVKVEATVTPSDVELQTGPARF
jgi:hypothetical protein